MRPDLVEQMGRDAFHLVVHGLRHAKQRISSHHMAAFLRFQHPTASDHEIDAAMARALDIHVEQHQLLIQRSQFMEESLANFRYNQARFNDFFRGDQHLDSS